MNHLSTPVLCFYCQHMIDPETDIDFETVDSFTGNMRYPVKTAYAHGHCAAGNAKNDNFDEFLTETDGLLQYESYEDGI